MITSIAAAVAFASSFFFFSSSFFFAPSSSSSAGSIRSDPSSDDPLPDTLADEADFFFLVPFAFVSFIFLFAFCFFASRATSFCCLSSKLFVFFGTAALSSSALLSTCPSAVSDLSLILFFTFSSNCCAAWSSSCCSFSILVGFISPRFLALLATCSTFSRDFIRAAFSASGIDPGGILLSALLVAATSGLSSSSPASPDAPGDDDDDDDDPLPDALPDAFAEDTDEVTLGYTKSSPPPGLDLPAGPLMPAATAPPPPPPVAFAGALSSGAPTAPGPRRDLLLLLLPLWPMPLLPRLIAPPLPEPEPEPEFPLLAMSKSSRVSPPTGTSDVGAGGLGWRTPRTSREVSAPVRTTGGVAHRLFWTGRAFPGFGSTRTSRLSCPSVTGSVFFNTNHSTTSEQGGVVSDPLYV